MKIRHQKAQELKTQEGELLKALRKWYVIPGVQADLRRKENEAVQTLIEVLERRQAAPKDA